MTISTRAPHPSQLVGYRDLATPVSNEFPQACIDQLELKRRVMSALADAAENTSYLALAPIMGGMLLGPIVSVEAFLQRGAAAGFTASAVSAAVVFGGLAWGGGWQGLEGIADKAASTAAQELRRSRNEPKCGLLGW